MDGGYWGAGALYHLSGGNFPSDEVNCVCPASKGIVWVGTIGGGLVRCDFSKGVRGMTYRSLTTREGLSNSNIRSLVLDRRDNLWAGTDDGLSRVDTKDNYIRRYSFTNLVLSNTFSPNCAMLLPDGRLAFGTAYGLVIVNPALDIHDSDMSKPVAPLISDISVNGMSIYDGLDSAILDKALTLSDRIKLKHNQNSLTFYFSSCDYRGIQAQVYQYWLEGVDRKWRQATTESHAEYSNLSPGNYVFHLRSVSQGGAGEETMLRVHIGQPWYNTVWAWVVYLIIIGGVVYYLWRNAKERFQMHQQVKLEKQVAEFRTNFFTHITHEFRTPLAIMQNALDKVSGRLGPTQKDVQTAQRGMRRLMRLVNSFLEYRRIQTGKMRLRVEKGDIVTFLQDIFMDFRGMAAQKHISVAFTPFAKYFEMFFDQQIVESVTYNLISNAIKYTPDGGAVTLTVRRDGGSLVVAVEDSGPGISGEQLDSLFRPFMEGHVAKGGMGIGLYTSFEMARLHHGGLAFANVRPHGSRFTLSLPVADEVYSADEHATAQQKKAADNGHYEDVIREMAPKAINSQRVAIIEDDPDMQEQIAGEVGVYFQTTVYGTGEAALEGIEKEPPSLILCDIMLPDTDGYEVVGKLRAKEALRGIPIIMLTALDDESHQIKGYQVGADDYMVKPCNFHLLIARIMQLIVWKEKREAEWKANAVQDETTAETPAGTAQASGQPILTSRVDKRFREQVEMIVSQHIDDQTLSVDRLAEMMSMGRTKFYGKVKDVFGMSPNKYLMSQRMEAAARYLEEGKHNVSEVSYKVGFSDPAYFNKCFKSYFGMVPSKYKNR